MRIRYLITFVVLGFVLAALVEELGAQRPAAARVTGDAAAVVVPPPGIVLPTGSEWQIYLADDPANWTDGATRQTLKDWSASTNHATRGANASVDSTDFALAADGGVFDGVNDQAVSISTNGWSSAASISGLVVFKSTNVGAWGCALTTGTSATLGNFGLCYGYPYSGSVSVQYFGYDYSSAASQASNGNWYCLVATKSPGAIDTTTAMYLDNSVVPAAFAATSTPTIGNNNLNLLGFFTPPGTVGPFTGTLATAVLWNRTLTAQEAFDACIYMKARLEPSGVTLPTLPATAPASLPTGSEWQIYLADDPANWQDGATKQTLKDWSASANHAYRGLNVGVASNDFTLAADGGVFDGSNDQGMSVSTNGWTDVTAASVLAVFKPADVATYGCMLGTGKNATLGNFGLCYGYPGVGSVSVDYYAHDYPSVGGQIADGNWYCLIGTKAPGAVNTTTTMYLNGSVIPASGASTSTPSIGNNNLFVLGKLTTLAGNSFNGTLAAVIFWKRTLTAQEAADAYSYMKTRLAPSGVTLP